MSNTEPTIQRIETFSDLDDVFYHGFFEVYSGCFSEAPYFQRISLERVKEDFHKMMIQGVFLCLRESNGRIDAFIAGSALENHKGALEDALKFTENQIDINNLSSYWYHSEIGVSKYLRGKRYARKLWEEMLHLLPRGYTEIFARTNKLNDDSLNMHKRFGFVCIPNSEHIVEDGDYTNIDHKPEDDTRVFLIRRCDRG